MSAGRGVVVAAAGLCAAVLSSPVGRVPGQPPALERLEALLPPAAITDVRMVGRLRWVSRPELTRAVATALRGGFFGVDIAAVRESVLSVAWVRDVSVRRVWPGELHVTVVEERPVARWAEGGLITDRGVRLPARTGLEVAGLPVFQGPLDAMNELLDGLDEFSSIFDGIGGGIERLERSAAGNWTLQFSDGVRLVFHEEQRPDVRRFAAIYLGALVGRRRSIERIDLRYPNGFAVRWRGGEDVHARARG